MECEIVIEKRRIRASEELFLDYTLSRRSVKDGFVLYSLLIEETFSGKSSSHDFTASNLFSRVACRLACKIVKCVMHDHGPANHVPHPESVGEKHRKRITARSKQRHKIPRMVRMRTVLRIIMGASIGKRVAFISRTRRTLVNVKRKYRILARCACNGKPCQFCGYQNPKRCFVKTDKPRNIGIFCTALHPCPRLRMVLKQCAKRQKQRISDQKTTPFLFTLSVYAKHLFLHHTSFSISYRFFQESKTFHVKKSGNSLNKTKKQRQIRQKNLLTYIFNCAIMNASQDTAIRRKPYETRIWYIQYLYAHSVRSVRTARFVFV